MWLKDPPNAGPGVSRARRLRMGDLADVQVSVVLSPQQSVVDLLWQASITRRDGSPESVAAIRRVLRPQTRFALHPVFSGHPPSLPDAAFPLVPRTDVTVAEQLEAIRDLPTSVLTDELRRWYGRELPRRWIPASEDPRRWLRSMAQATEDAWSVVAWEWRRSQPQLAREIRRVGTAVVRGGLDALLNSLHPRIRYTDGVLSYSYGVESLADLNGRRLVLVPMIAGPHGTLGDFAPSDFVYLAYPVGATIEGTSPDAANEDVVAHVLGSLRAALLRASMRSASIGQVAAAAGCSASLATYHCAQLEAAGLIRRERRGRTVHVSHTTRGAELLDLLS